MASLLPLWQNPCSLIDVYCSKREIAHLRMKLQGTFYYFRVYFNVEVATHGYILEVSDICSWYCCFAWRIGVWMACIIHA